ncbi:MAG TPA: PVC-type heme-binding CxxCH protein, partial [Isosphaeraceae bacterium]|nr:PVC-type heme-binding CxxCH protein [Isosphaeraceae bacterium]
RLPRLAAIVLVIGPAVLGGGLDQIHSRVARAQVRSEPPELIPHGQDRAPNAPRSPAEAIRAMTVPPGFAVELVAAEPDLVNPVAMTFDERGRIWITESLEYPRRQPGPGRDRVKVLEDTDGDGRADTFTVFADGLNIPSGIAVGYGGVWVANAPEILFLQDRDGDGRAETREVVVTGFGRADTHELPNSLTWGPDGWLYGWNGVFNPSKVASRNGRTYEFTCAIFRIHPRTRVFEVWCEGTSNPWGIAIDPQGSFFASACVIDHLWHLVETGYYLRQGGPYPPFTWPIGSIVDHSHQKAAYCGIHYFDSPAYPREYRGRLYMGNIHGNCINVDTLVRNGSTYRAEPAADFLQANDSWFMPVAQKTGPDGCLYILDWYDQYHCYQDANRDPAGIDRLKGRLYRVRYHDTPRRFGFDLARSSDDELIRLLASPNVYDRDLAQRLLTERSSPTIRRKLQTMVLGEKAPDTARMHGLWALIGAGPLDPGFHANLVSRTGPAFRAWGVRAAGNMGRVEPAVLEKVLVRAGDPSPDVRLQVAIAARKLQDIDPLPVLIALQANSSHDALIPQIVWQNLHPLLEDRQAELARWIGRVGLGNLGFNRLLPRMIDRLLATPKGDPQIIAGALVSCDDAESCRQAVDLVAARFRERSLPPGREDALKRAFSKELSGANWRTQDRRAFDYRVLLTYCGDHSSLKEMWTIARTPRKTADSAVPDFEQRRGRALEAILYRRMPGAVGPLVKGILAEDDSSSSVAFRGKVLDAMAEWDDPELAPMVLQAYARLPAQLKPKAIELLTERPAWARALLDAVADQRIPATVLNVTQLRTLQQSKHPTIAGRVKSIWGTIRQQRNPRRELVVDQVRRSIRRMTGDPIAGQAVFKKLCAQCHKIHGQGQEVGPDLTSNGRNDFNQLLSNVFDPSLVIGPGYQATTVATTDGRILTGLLAEQGRDRVVLKLQGGKLETVPRDQIEQMKTAEVSLMPEDVEKQLAPQEIADLFAFLCLDKPPTDPAARPLPGAGPIRKR